MFNIEEELKKLPARPGVYICGQGDQLEEPGAPVFSRQPEPGYP